MLSQCLRGSKALPLRSLRPLRQIYQSKCRPFTQNTQLLLLTRSSLRPQLPYLAQSSVYRRLSPLDQHVLRLLSTESRRLVQDYAWLTVKWTTITWTFLFLINIVVLGVTMEVVEQKDPTPTEWSFWTRQAMRRASYEIGAWQKQGYINWSAAGSFYLEAIARLEDPKIDGQGIVAQQPAETGSTTTIADIGAVHYDISEKSWAWRQGYFEALMGIAQASESMDTMVRDVSRNLIFPKSTMIGPSNPDPRPVTTDMEAAPLEENCERPFDPPEKYYTQILISDGFTTRQKIAAALAYSNWLEYTGCNEAATEMLNWSVDIASRAALDDSLPPGSFVLKSGAIPSENLLKALTAWGVQQARIGNTTTALPTLLAVLRARKEASTTIIPSKSRDTVPITDFGVVLQAFRNFITPKPFPDPPTSGNEPFTKPAQLSCDDSELMLYIGEIMFASSTQQLEGLAWTKQAAEMAEREVLSPSVSTLDAKETYAEAKRCRQCLRAGVENWEFMLDEIISQESAATIAATTDLGIARRLGWSKQNSIHYDADQLAAESSRLAQLKESIKHSEKPLDTLNIRRSTTFTMLPG